MYTIYMLYMYEVGHIFLALFADTNVDQLFKQPVVTTTFVVTTAAALKWRTSSWTTFKPLKVLSLLWQYINTPLQLQ